jgi:hypothetical protein
MAYACSHDSCWPLRKSHCDDRSGTLQLCIGGGLLKKRMILSGIHLGHIRDSRRPRNYPRHISHVPRHVTRHAHARCSGRAQVFARVGVQHSSRGASHFGIATGGTALSCSSLSDSRVADFCFTRTIVLRYLRSSLITANCRMCCA